MHIRRLSLGLALTFTLLAPVLASGQVSPEPDTSKLPRLQAELLKTLAPNHLKAGDEVTARTITPLEVAGSKFAPGSIVKGRVAEVEPSRLVLLFDEIVVKKNLPIPLGLSLRAVMMPHPQSSPSSSSDPRSPRSEALGGTSPNPAVASSNGGPMRSAEAAAADSVYMPSQGPPKAAATPVETRNGGVVGLPDVLLEVSRDPKVGAVFRAENDHKLQLEKGLQLMFVVSEPSR